MRKVNRWTKDCVYNQKKEGKHRISGNTYVVIENGAAHVFLFDNHIATWFGTEGTLKISSAGFQTRTTRDRLNSLLAVPNAFYSAVFLKANELFYRELNKEPVHLIKGYWHSIVFEDEDDLFAF